MMTSGTRPAAREPADRDQITAAVTARYAGLARAGFTGITLTPTHQVADGVHSAIIRAAKP
jgi:hypothetical protein